MGQAVWVSWNSLVRVEAATKCPHGGNMWKLGTNQVSTPKNLRRVYQNFRQRIEFRSVYRLSGSLLNESPLLSVLARSPPRGTGVILAYAETTFHLADEAELAAVVRPGPRKRTWWRSGGESVFNDVHPY